VNEDIADWIKDAASFDVEPGDYYGTGHLPLPMQGVFLSEHRFVVTDKQGKIDTRAASLTP
jgi:hypothetical protein